MFRIEFDQRNKVIWARYHGRWSRADIEPFDRAMAHFVATHGCAHLVLDFSNVDSVAMHDEALFERGKRPQRCPGFQRVVVAPHSEVSELYRLFAANQARVGSAAPKIVKTFDHALIHLGVGKPGFVPFEMPANEA